MNGDNLARRVRAILRDETSDTVKGEFWRDEEILLSLNAAQDVFVDFCLRGQRRDLIKGLIKSSPYQTAGTTDSLLTVAADYLMYSSAQVGPGAGQLRMSRVYLGGEGYDYLYVNHDATVILGNDIYFIDDGDPQGGGVLHYYKQPSYIGLSEYNDPTDPGATDPRADFTVQDFDDYIYYDLMAIHASVMLGAKEPTTQRDFKNYSSVVSQIVLYPQYVNNYVDNYENLLVTR